MLSILLITDWRYTIETVIYYFLKISMEWQIICLEGLQTSVGFTTRIKNYNVAPYYDDFDETKNFHRILFRPGFSVQARELTQLQ